MQFYWFAPCTYISDGSGVIYWNKHLFDFDFKFNEIPRQKTEANCLKAFVLSNFRGNAWKM